MRESAATRALTRPADNELYDRGCDLVEASAAIQRLAADQRAIRAVPAVLGCLDAALHELSRASAALEETLERAALERRRITSRSSFDAVTERTRRGFLNLECALADAGDAATAARALAARYLAP
jgi:hypothetical protein